MEPINAKGGDDQDEISYMYGCLLDDAIQRNLDHNELYYISDEMLLFFVAVQGYEEFYYSVQAGNISRLRMAHEIWRVMPKLWYTDVYQQLIDLNLPHLTK